MKWKKVIFWELSLAVSILVWYSGLCQTRQVLGFLFSNFIFASSAAFPTFLKIYFKKLYFAGEKRGEGQNEGKFSFTFSVGKKIIFAAFSFSRSPPPSPSPSAHFPPCAHSRWMKSLKRNPTSEIIKFYFSFSTNSLAKTVCSRPNQPLRCP